MKISGMGWYLGGEESQKTSSGFVPIMVSSAIDPGSSPYSQRPAFHGHVAGCYENDDGHIVFDLTVADGNVFFFFPPLDEKESPLAKRNQLRSPTCRWIFDPKAKSGTR